MKLGQRRHGRNQGALLALLVALVALIGQALLPAAALAAQGGGVSYQVLCTSDGAKTVAVDESGQPKKGFAGLPCQDCLAAAAALTFTPGLTVAPAAYAAQTVRHAAAADRPAPRARAPPRPPGQGPPNSNA